MTEDDPYTDTEITTSKPEDNIIEDDPYTDITTSTPEEITTSKPKDNKPKGNKLSNIVFGVICGILLILIILITLYTLDKNLSITKKNVTVNNDLTVNGTLTAKAYATETTFDNIACDDITASGTITSGAITSSGMVTAGQISTSGAITSSGTVTAGEISTSGTITSGAINCDGALIASGGEIVLVQNGASNYGASTFSTGGLYIGANMTSGYAEMDIIAVNSYMGANGGPTTPILNIYTSNTEVVSAGAQNGSTLAYTYPIVSISESEVIIGSDGGNLQVNGTVQCFELLFSSSSGNAYFNLDSTNLILSVASGSGLQFSTPSGSGTILCTGSNQLTVGGTLIANVTSSSDYRLKEEIMPISDEYSIDKLKPCSYLLKDDESKKLQTGFIAHEIQEIFPHLVNGEKDAEDMQSVNYIGLIAILTKELQSLKSVVGDLQEDNIILKAKVVELEKKYT